MPVRRSPPRLFLLSPAHAGGKRAQLLLNENASFALAERLRDPDGVPLGEAFSFVSGLYFRGKVTYARRFARPPAGTPGTYVITASRGLVPEDACVGPRDLREFAGVDIHADDPRYRAPLERDVAGLLRIRGAELVLLGSIATGKYVDVLLEMAGARLLFPVDFVGRGDMSRGGLLLRAARAGAELEYAPVAGAVRRGPRARKLGAIP
jgi:hypothetical protein